MVRLQETDYEVSVLQMIDGQWRTKDAFSREFSSKKEARKYAEEQLHETFGDPRRHTQVRITEIRKRDIKLYPTISW